MKKITALLLAVLLLCGCQANVSTETTAAPETTQAPTDMTIPTETTAPEGFTFPTISLPESIFGTPEGEEIPFANPGKTRLTYKGDVVDIRYITSVEQLPDAEALAHYDAAYFENKALLIVVETYTSGSLQVELEGIRVNGDTAIVSLKRTMPGDVGTADMATWLLWAEVEKGLEYTWCIKDRPQESVGEKY